MKTITDWTVKILIVIAWIGFCFWIFSTLTGCSHTKKAFSEISRKFDSVFVTRHDTSYRNKKDSSNTVIDLHNVDIIIPVEDDPNKINPSDYFPPAELARIKKIFQPSGGFTATKTKGAIIVHSDDIKITHGQITTVSSGKGSKVDSTHVKSDEHAKTKTVDRKGTNLMSTIIIWACIIGLLVFLVLKFKSKIPIIKNL